MGSTGSTRAERIGASARSARFYFWPIIVANVLVMTVGAQGDLAMMAWFALVIASLSSYGFLVNDLLDRKIDLANRAGHFETSDPATIVVAWIAAAGFGVLGLGVAYSLGPQSFAIAAASAIGLTIYSPVLRRIALVPNVTTAVFATGPLWAPLVLSISGGAGWQWWLVAAMLGLLTAREILMDVRDRAGDAVGGRRTVATWFGAQKAARIGAALTVAATVPFGWAVMTRALALTTAQAVLGVVVAGIMAWLAVRFALAIAQSSGEYARPVQAYVRTSRLVMLLMPALAWLLSG